MKMPKFGNKSALFEYFCARILKILLSYLKSPPSNLSHCKILRKTKKPKFGTKNALLWYLWARILENYCHIWNQHLRICLITKCCKEMKIPKFGTKNALFGYFFPRMPYLGIFGLAFFKKTIVMFGISTLEFV